MPKKPKEDELLQEQQQLMVRVLDFLEKLDVTSKSATRPRIAEEAQKLITDYEVRKKSLAAPEPPVDEATLLDLADKAIKSISKMTVWAPKREAPAPVV